MDVDQTCFNGQLFCDDLHRKAVLKSMCDLRKKGIFCDVILKICGRQILAHATVLSAASEYFLKFLNGEDNPTNCSQLFPQIIEIQIDGTELNDLYEKVVNLVIDFMYTGTIMVTHQNIAMIEKIGNLWHVTQLTDYCKRLRSNPKHVEPTEEPAKDLTVKIMKEASFISSTATSNTSGKANCVHYIDRAKLAGPHHVQINKSIKKPRQHSVGTQACISSTHDKLVGSFAHIKDKVNGGVKEAFSRKREFATVENLESKVVKCSKKDSSAIENFTAIKSDFQQHDMITNSKAGVTQVEVYAETESTFPVENNAKQSKTVSHIVRSDDRNSPDYGLIDHPMTDKSNRNGESYSKPLRTCREANLKRTDLTIQLLNGSAKEDGKSSIENYSPSQQKQRGRPKMCEYKDAKLATLTCDECSFSTPKKRVFAMHKEDHLKENLICRFCNLKKSTPEELQSHIESHGGDNPFVCLHCMKTFKTRTRLQNHTVKHSTDRPFVCAECGVGFKWKHALETHSIVHRTDRKPFTCDTCGYTTTLKTMLNAHYKVHTGDTLKCSHPGCKFEAIAKSNLRLHMVVHTKERPHQCDICGNRFSFKKNLKRHMLLHGHPSDNITCDICDFSTTRTDKLDSHKRLAHNLGSAPQRRRTIHEMASMKVDIEPFSRSKGAVAPAITEDLPHNIT